MKIIFFIPYYNNSHFIDVQIKSFNKYLNCEYKIVLVDDSTEKTINVLTNEKENFKIFDLKYPNQIIYHKIDQNIHTSTNVTTKHSTILNFIIKILSQQYKDDYDYMSILDADMCFIDYFDVEKELENYDIISPKRIQWLSNIQISDSPIFDFIWVHCCFFNLKTIKNLTDINFNTIKNTTTDTGAMIIEFLHNNPHLKIKFLNFSSGAENIPELNYCEFFWNFKILHFGSGSLWNKDLVKYKNLTYNNVFNKFCEIADKGLTEEDNKVIEDTYNDKWYPFHKKFVGKKYTRDDLLRYGMNV